MMRSNEQHRDIGVEIQFYEGILAQDPDYVEALLPLAEAYTRAGLYEKGLEADQRLAKLRPKDASVHYNLACSWALTGHKEEALAAVEHAVELGFNDVELLMKDEDLALLHDVDEFAQLIARFFPDVDLDAP
jgi:tetratricopeptide (TPR) repeat protein